MAEFQSPWKRHVRSRICAISTHTRTRNAANELTDVSGDWIDPACDAAGNMTAGPVPGQETTRKHFIYDAWNRLVEIKNDDGGQPDTTLVKYSYDALHRRIHKAFPGGSNWLVYDYYYNTSWQRGR